MQPLLLLHGALGTKELFHPLMKELASAYELHTIDFSGHGESPLNGGFSIPAFAEEVIAYMDARNLSSADIFGYSMGGYVGLYLCHLYPVRIRSLFTLGTKIFWTETSAQAETSRLDADKIMAKVPAFAEELRRRHKHTEWKEMLELTKNMMLELGRINLLNEDILKTIQQTVCIGIGDKDNTVPAEEAINAYKQLSQGQLAILPATPHPLERVSPELLGVVLRRFFG